MATQSVIQSVPQQKSALQFPARPITQTELVLFLSLRDQLEQLQEQITVAQEKLKALLEAGATVQPGDHIARLGERSRRNVAWREISESLGDAVFGDGNGALYCAEVLAVPDPQSPSPLYVR